MPARSGPSYQDVSQHEDTRDPEIEQLLRPHLSAPTSPSLFVRLSALSLRSWLVLLVTCASIVCLLHSLYANPLSQLWPSTRPTHPLCLPLSSPYQHYLEQHRRVRHLLETDCASAWNGSVYPRLLVHVCQAGCSGLGDRVGKAAGLFLFALLSNRTLFLDHTLPVMADWYEPTPDFDWSVSGSLKRCLDYGRRFGQQERFNSDALGLLGRFPPVHEARWEANHWGWQNGWRGFVRKTFLPRPSSDVRLPSESALYIDGPVNLIRPLEIVSEFHQAVDDGRSRGLIPWPTHTDDTLSTMLTGCLLSQLWKPSQKTLQLVAPLLQQAGGSCLVSVHVRFGDFVMFKYNSSTLEGTETDRHIEPQPAVVVESLRCVVTQAHHACTPQAQAGGLRVFFATDTPQFNHWFDAELAELVRWDRAEWGIKAFPSIKLLKSPWEKPGNVVSFSIITQGELEEAEKQLMSDWTMLSLAKVTVTTGSVFSYTAAANGLRFPINSKTCAVRWWR